MRSERQVPEDWELTFNGHASMSLTRGRTSVVTDPWFSESGAFLGAWSQFPDNSNVSLGPVRDATFIALTHDHEDHFDLEFLRTVSPSTTLLVPDYDHPRLRDLLLRELRNPVRVVRDRTPVDLGDGITMVPIRQTVPVWDDCAFVFQCGDMTVVDLNDIKLPASDLDWISRNFDVDYLLLQFSGANWYPAAYTYDSDTKAELAREKVETKFRAVANIVEHLDPACVVPCAGPPCFLREEQFDLNFASESIFPTQAEFMEFARSDGFADRVAVLVPGDVLRTSTDWSALTRANLASPPFARREEYLRDYQRRRLPAIESALSRIVPPDGTLVEKCSAYFEPLIRSTPDLAARIGGVVLLELTGEHPERIVVDFTRPEEPVRAFAGEPWFYRLRTDARFVNEILEGRLTWEELLLSMRFEATRTPDVYNEHLIVFLRYADPEHHARYEWYQRRDDYDARFVIEHSGRQLFVQRTCPHAGGDLSKGCVEGDELVCPVHGWRFSLIDGSCARTGREIAIEEIAAVDSATSTSSTTS
ncbi:MAG: Rieske 2Fe-2S domain-containing protein [Acidimicrobiia bacterium]